MRISAIRDNLQCTVRALWHDRVTLQFGLVVFAACLALIAGHITTLQFADASRESIGFKLWDNLRLDHDDKFPEKVGHGLAMIAAAFFFMSFLTSRVRSLLVMSILSAIIWLDDSSSYHERAGKFIAEHLDFRSSRGLRSQDFGELAAWALLGAVFTLASAYALRRPTTNDLVVGILGLFPLVLIGICGIVVDMLHQLSTGGLAHALAVIEDGGELIGLAGLSVLSAGLLRAATLTERQTASTLPAEERANLSLA